MIEEYINSIKPTRMTNDGWNDRKFSFSIFKILVPEFARDGAEGMKAALPNSVWTPGTKTEKKTTLPLTVESNFLHFCFPEKQKCKVVCRTCASKLFVYPH